MDQIWLCELEALRVYCDKVIKASEETERSAALAFAEAGEPGEILSVAGDTAAIDIRGTLSNTPSVIGRFFGFGSTSYPDIQRAIATVAADERVKTVRLLIDSPGGGVTGLDEVWIALRELGKTKRIIAENRGLMASAAYWIASAAHEIVAASPAAETGSIGVYALFVDWTAYDKKAGIKEIRIVSKNAPEKNPDLATASGLKSFQARLDAIERVFIDRVANGRGRSAADVAANFGRGGLLIAADPDASKPSALSVGMVDSVIGVTAPAGKAPAAVADGAIPPVTENNGIDNEAKNVENLDRENTAAADTSKPKVKNMAKLADLVAEDAELAADIDKIKAEASKVGADEHAARVAAATPILSGDYPAFIKEKAIALLKGETTAAELSSAVSTHDSMVEAAKAEAAKKETENQGATPPAPPTQGAADGRFSRSIPRRKSGSFSVTKPRPTERSGRAVSS